MYKKKLVKNMQGFNTEIIEAISLRHSIGHKNNYELDTLKVLRSIKILEEYFTIIDIDYKKMITANGNLIN